MFNIVLVAPEIPQNTGNVGRLCVNSNARLHLIRPLGFAIDAATVRRAGLDYWEDLNLSVHDSWKAFLESESPQILRFISTRGRNSVYSCHFSCYEYLVFGSETSGLPPGFYSYYRDSLYKIPMAGEGSRSLNLANAVSIVLYEGLRQVEGWSEVSSSGSSSSCTYSCTNDRL